MFGGFLTGIVIGVMLGLALYPVLEAWIVWRSTERSRSDFPIRTPDAEPEFAEDGRQAR